MWKYTPDLSYMNIFVLKTSTNWGYLIEKEMKEKLSGFPEPKIKLFEPKVKALGVCLEWVTYLVKESWLVPF